MDWLHYHDDIGPFDQLDAKRVNGIVVSTSGGSFYTRAIGEYFFRRRAAQVVLTANEENVDHAAILT